MRSQGPLVQQRSGEFSVGKGEGLQMPRAAGLRTARGITLLRRRWLLLGQIVCWVKALSAWQGEYSHGTLYFKVL